jgi:hypothetical protein
MPFFLLAMLAVLLTLAAIMAVAYFVFRHR